MTDIFDKYRNANSFKTLYGGMYPKSEKTVSKPVKVDACNVVGEDVLKEQIDIAGSRMPGSEDGL